MDIKTAVTEGPVANFAAVRVKIAQSGPTVGAGLVGILAAGISEGVARVLHQHNFASSGFHSSSTCLRPAIPSQGFDNTLRVIRLRDHDINIGEWILGTRSYHYYCSGPASAPKEGDQILDYIRRNLAAGQENLALAHVNLKPGLPGGTHGDDPEATSLESGLPTA
jgi:hypothetical protein